MLVATEEIQCSLQFNCLQLSKTVVLFSFVGCLEGIREENLFNEACNNLALGLDREEKSSSSQEQSNRSFAMSFVTSKRVPVTLKGTFTDV